LKSEIGTHKQFKCTDIRPHIPASINIHSFGFDVIIRLLFTLFSLFTQTDPVDMNR